MEQNYWWPILHLHVQYSSLVQSNTLKNEKPHNTTCLWLALASSKSWLRCKLKATGYFLKGQALALTTSSQQDISTGSSYFTCSLNHVKTVIILSFTLNWIFQTIIAQQRELSPAAIQQAVSSWVLLSAPFFPCFTATTHLSLIILSASVC